MLLAQLRREDAKKHHESCLCAKRSAMLVQIRRDSPNYSRCTCPRGATLAGLPQAGWVLSEGNRMRRWLALSLLALGVSSSLVLAQIGTATLTGRVTDPSGAVVPGVSI